MRQISGVTLAIWRWQFQFFYRISGSRGCGKNERLDHHHFAMKKTKRFVFGVLSCLLLAAGFARAADRLDLINNNLTNITLDKIEADTSVLTPPCVIQPN
jgi:hypothetical protein